MKKIAIFIIIGSLLSGFFLPGILGVPLINNIAFAQVDGPQPPPGSTTDGNGITVVPEGGSSTEGSGNDSNTQTQQGSPISDYVAQSPFDCNAEFSAAVIINCMGAILYIPFYVTQYITGWAGYFLDIMIDYSTQSASYESEFVSEGWKIIRDLTNIGFIFALLYIAISTIVGQGSAKSTLVWVIIMALVVNFSFFTTRVVIDASNILARVFYQNMNIQSDSSDPNQTSQAKPITAALISKIDIQNILDETGEALNSEHPDANPVNLALGGVFIIILVTVMNAVMIFVFFSIAMLFVGRVIGLWFSIIASPLAFLSIAFPGGKGWRRVGWDAWLNDLWKTAFLAPVFLFFIYLIILFLNTGFLASAMSGGTGMIDVLIGLLIPFAFFMTLLLTAKNISTEMAGQIASTVTGYLNTAMMAVGGVAMAGTALVGGAAASAAGGAIARAGARKLAANATGTSSSAKMGRFVGRTMSSTGRNIKAVNWDPRNAPGMSQISKMTGISMPTTGQEFSNKYGSGKGFSEMQEKRSEDWRKKKQARADELADAVAKYGKPAIPGASTYQESVNKATDNRDEFMSRFGHVLENLDKKIKEESINLRTANQTLQAAKESGDLALIKKAQDDQKDALTKYSEAKTAKEEFTKGEEVTVDGVKHKGEIIDPKTGKAKSLKDIKEDVEFAQKEMTAATTEARNFYAEEIKTASASDKTIDAILSGGASMGQHKQASRDVRNKAKEEEKKTPKPEPTTT